MRLKKKKEMAPRTITSHQSWKPPLTEATLTAEKSRIRKPDEATLLWKKEPNLPQSSQRSFKSGLLSAISSLH